MPYLLFAAIPWTSISVKPSRPRRSLLPRPWSRSPSREGLLICHSSFRCQRIIISQDIRPRPRTRPGRHRAVLRGLRLEILNLKPQAPSPSQARRRSRLLLDSESDQWSLHQRPLVGPCCRQYLTWCDGYAYRIQVLIQVPFDIMIRNPSPSFNGAP